MQEKYKRALTFLAFLIILCSAIGIAYIFYDKVKSHDDTIVEADGDLSINYIQGKKIKENGVYLLSITNNSNKDLYYEIKIKDVDKWSSGVQYSLTSLEANLHLTRYSFEKDNLLLADNILIKSKETQNFKLEIYNNLDMSFILDIHKINDTEEYFFATILKNNEVKKDLKTKLVEESATSNEGLIEDVDDYGLTYYFRGNVKNNYVSFANQMWRIIRINGDGSVRLILDGEVSELSSYHSNMEQYEDYAQTDINKNLQSYYQSNLKNEDQYIANAKFCIENGANEGDKEKIYNAYTRIITNKIPTLNCLGEKYTSKIGLITVDEVIFAGANIKDGNKDFYLYNKKIDNVWWTSSLAKMKDNHFYPFSITNEGKLTSDVNGTLYRRLRPVINIVKKVVVTGNGTLDDPYVITK